MGRRIAHPGRRSWRTAIAVCALWPLLAPAACAAIACDCEPLPLSDQIDRATAIFIGRLLEVPVNIDTQERSFVFEPLDMFKGDERDTFVLIDADRGTSCESAVQEGDYFLVYAYWRWGIWKTSICWGTKPMKQATPEEVERLGLPTSQKERLYENLRVRCMGLYTTNCCLASIRAMRKGHYVPEPAGGCPEGTKPDQLRCRGGYRWCIPFRAPAELAR